jgi:hypothetical protein
MLYPPISTVASLEGFIPSKRFIGSGTSGNKFSKEREKRTTIQFLRYRKYCENQKEFHRFKLVATLIYVALTNQLTNINTAITRHGSAGGVGDGF